MTLVSLSQCLKGPFCIFTEIYEPAWAEDLCFSQKKEEEDCVSVRLFLWHMVQRITNALHFSHAHVNERSWTSEAKRDMSE